MPRRPPGRRWPATTPPRQGRHRRGGDAAGAAVARRSAVKARSQAANQLDSLVVTAPDQLRAKLRRLPAARLVEAAAALRPGKLDSPVAAVKLALRELARRHQALSAEIDRLDAHIGKLAGKTALGCWLGAGRRPGRDRPAGRRRRQPRQTGKPGRVRGAVRRLADRGVLGQDRPASPQPWRDRQANNALWTIVITRMACDQRTRRYVQRRTSEGKSKKEIIRCLKRYVAREVYRDVQATALLTT
jgi:hypothetical protein